MDAQYGEVLHQTGVFHPNGAAHRPVCRILILQRFVNGASRHELLCGEDGETVALEGDPHWRDLRLAVGHEDRQVGDIPGTEQLAHLGRKLGHAPKSSLGVMLRVSTGSGAVPMPGPMKEDPGGVPRRPAVPRRLPLGR